MNNNKFKRKFVKKFINKNNSSFIKFVESELLEWIHSNYGYNNIHYMDSDYWDNLFDVFININDGLLQDLYFKTYYHKLFFNENEDDLLQFDNISVDEIEHRLNEHILYNYNPNHTNLTKEEYLKEEKKRMKERIDFVERDEIEKIA